MFSWRPREITSRIIIHDTHTGPEVQDVEAYLMVRGRVHGLLDIGYHYLIQRDGKIVECRPSEAVGSHCPGNNHDSVGVALVGNHRLFEECQLIALDDLVHSLRKAYGPVQLVGHTEIQRYKDRRRCCPSIDMDARRLFTDQPSLMEGYTVPETPPATTLSPQTRIVLDYLKAGRTLTNMVALTALGVGSLSSRIAELRKEGFNIVGRREKDRFGREFVKYDYYPENSV